MATSKATRGKIGKNIRKGRKKSGYSQERLAELVTISRTHMGHIEQGRRSPSLKTLVKIAKALKVPLEELFK